MTYSEFSPYLFWYAQITTGLLAVLLIITSVKGYRATENKKRKILHVVVVFAIWIVATVFIQIVNALYIIANTHNTETREEQILVFNKSFWGLIIYQIFWILLSLCLAFFVSRKPKTKLS